MVSLCGSKWGLSLAKSIVIVATKNRQKSIDEKEGRLGTVSSKLKDYRSLAERGANFLVDSNHKQRS